MKAKILIQQEVYLKLNLVFHQLSTKPFISSAEPMFKYFDTLYSSGITAGALASSSPVPSKEKK